MTERETGRTPPESLDMAALGKRMDGAIETLKHEFASLRSGRATPSLLDGVVASVHGATMPVSHLASVTTLGPRLLGVQVWDRANVAAVEKAILGSRLGLNPVADGQLLRIPLPDLTEERRQELARAAGAYAEQARVAVRNVRRDGMEHLRRLERAHAIGEDERKRLEAGLQKLTDGHISTIDDLLAARQKDITHV